MLQTEKEDLAVNFEQAERSRRQAELEAVEARETINALSNSNASLSATKRKYEQELQAIHSEMNDLLNELKHSEERSKKASIDAARLSEELRAEQEHAQNLDRTRKGYELQFKDLQARLDEAEGLALKGGKKIIAKMESKIRELEAELDGESRRHQETHKHLRNKDRRARELQFQVEEDKKASERMYDLVEKLQGKIKTYKRQVEEAEQLATVNLAKYRQLQHLLEDAEERADLAENSLAKMRAKSRSNVNIRAGLGLAHSMSSTGLAARSISRSRNDMADE
jgi:myosin heavy chain 6/7